ncbi:hypothetical protein A5678_15510 [Mycobacterium sp. E2733]|nr:hypothetical protein A5678_15510 [Mycobacterium sp. E2733]
MDHQARTLQPAPKRPSKNPLTPAITQTLESVKPGERVLVASTVNRAEDETLSFRAQLAALGVAPNNAGRGRFAEIPTTPWQHSTFSIPDRSATCSASDTNPLLGGHTEVPGGQVHIWQADVGTDVIPWLADYRVHGQAVLPTAAVAEIGLAAATQALGVPVHAVSINRLSIEQLLPLESHTPLTTQLIRDVDNTIRLEVHTQSSTGDWCRHAVAQVDVSFDSTDAAIRDISGRFLESPGDARSPADFYAAQHRGPAFTALTRIVELPEGVSETEIMVPDEAPRYVECRIHPVLLDAALQSLLTAAPGGRAATESDGGTLLPVSFESIRVFGEAGRHARCRAKVINSDDDGAGVLGSITLTDDAGIPTAEITGVRLRRIEREAVPIPLSNKLFETTWVEAPIAVQSPSSGTAGSWLILSDDTDAKAADEFAAQWRSPTRRVTTASLVDESAVLAAFAEASADPDSPPTGVVALIGDDPRGMTDPHASLQSARDSIWFLASVIRALVGGWHGRSPRVWLVSRNGLVVRDGEPGQPRIGALRGLIRVLAYEHPELGVTLIDLDSGADAASTMTTEVASPSSDDVIAWRGRHRFIERLARAGIPTRASDPVIRRDGAYIVTGGLGGLGLTVARWLADRGARRVVLNGRSRPSDDQLKVIAELQDRCEIEVVRGDIATPDVAQRLVGAAQATGLQLRGVLHLAAVIDDSLLIAMSRESLDRVWAPKAAGALRLHEATAGLTLDWWLLFSSTASLLGSPGQTAYASANAWLDALVSWRHTLGLPAAAIHWGPWSDVGVARSLPNAAVDPISPAEGIAALESVVASGRVHTGVARLRPDRALAAFPEIRQLGYFSEVIGELATAGDDGGWTGPEGLQNLDPVEAGRIVTERLCARVAAVMGHAGPAAVDLRVPLTEAGMDSLMAVRIRNTARVDFGIEPPVALLLQGASLQDLADHLLGQLGLVEDRSADRHDRVRNRAQQRAAARQGAALRRKKGQPL